MKELKEVSRPTLPCDSCMENNAETFAPSGGNLVFVYCSHNHAGCILLKGSSGGVWNIYTPIIQADFADVVESMSTTFLFRLKKTLVSSSQAGINYV